MSSATELAVWLAGIPTGGPNGDGRYPLTYADGLTYLVYCPAAQALNPALAEEPIEVFANTASTAAATAIAESDEAQQASTNAQTYAANSLASSLAAAISAASAQTYRVDALGFAGDANAFSQTSASHAGTANSAAGQAANSASNALTSANNAATSASAAASSASAAATSASVIPAGGTVGQFLWKTDAGNYVTGWHTLVKGDVGLGNVDNTSDANKPVSTAQAAADALKVSKTGDTMSGDLTLSRLGAPTTGALFFGNTALRYLYYDGTNYIMPNAALLVNNAPVWTSSTFDPTLKANVADTVSSVGAYLTGGNANNTPNNWMGPIADPAPGGPEGSWTNLISFGAGGGTTGQYQHQIGASWFNDTLYVRAKNGTTTYTSWKKIWTAGNDGTGSGLDADNLRGVPGNWFLNGDNATGTGTAQDMNSPAKSGFYQSSSGQNGPGVANWHWYIHHEHTSTGYGFQMANLIANNDDYHLRNRSGGVWGAWRKIWHTGNFTPANYALLSGCTFTGTVTIPTIAPTGAAGASITGNGSGIGANGAWYFNQKPIVLTADSAAWLTLPRTFVQSGDPGAQAADGDLWIW